MDGMRRLFPRFKRPWFSVWKPALAIVAAAVATAVVALAVAAPAVATQDYPAPTGYVNDFANVLTAAERATLTATIVQLENETGAELAVAIVTSVGDNTVKGYAVDLFEAWGVGKQGRDNGLLILLALMEREIQVEVGYGLEPILPDGLVGRILDEMVPSLSAQRYGEGLLVGVEAIAARIRAQSSELGDDGQTPTPSRVSSEIYWFGLLGAFIILGGLFGAVWFNEVRRRRCPRCGTRMKLYNRVQSRPAPGRSGVGERVFECLRCGFTRKTTYAIHGLHDNGGGRAGPMVPPSRPFGGWGRPGSGGRFGGGGFGGFGGGRSGGGGAGRGF